MPIQPVVAVSPMTELARAAAGRARRQHFRLECLNRVDAIEFFNALTFGEITCTVDLLTEKRRGRLADRDPKLVLSEDASV
jgi:ATP-dependent Clp protease ATP-binding subunit ClpA